MAIASVPISNTLGKDSNSAETELREFEKKIDLFNLLSDRDLPDEVKSVRHRILAIHSFVENRLNSDIHWRLTCMRFGKNNSILKSDFQNNQEEIYTMRKKVDGMSFAQKKELVKLMGIYAPELIQKITAFNQDRNVLAHQDGKDIQVIAFSQPVRRVEVLRRGWEIISELNKVREIQAFKEVMDKKLK